MYRNVLQVHVCILSEILFGDLVLRLTQAYCIFTFTNTHIHATNKMYYMWYTVKSRHEMDYQSTDIKEPRAY